MENLVFKFFSFVDLGTLCLNIFFMKFLDPSDRVLVSVTLNVRAETAELLEEMAREMELSIDDVLSAIAEDATIGSKKCDDFFEDIYIPDSCSTKDLLEALS